MTATFQQEGSVGGPLRAASSITVSNETGSGWTAYARAGYYDQYVVSASSGAAPAFLRFSLEVDGVGTLVGTDVGVPTPTRPGGGGYHFALFSVYNFGTQDVPSTYAATRTTGQRGAAIATQPNLGTVNLSVDVPLVGSVNNLLFQLLAASSVGRPSWVAAGDPWSATATSDFFNTLRITGVSVLDAQRQDISSSVRLASASGTVVTPEPSTWALLGAGLLAVGGMAARRRRTTV